MTENMKKLLEILSKDEAAYKKAGALEKDALIAFAKELGVDLTERDFEAPEEALSADELAAVAGGGDCVCVAGGGGTEEGDDNACGCVGLGLGVDSAENAYRCYCYIGGYGS